MVEDRTEIVRELIDSTEIQLLVAINNGLFNQTQLEDSKPWTEIEDIVKDARHFLKAGNLEDAETQQSIALGHLQEALSKPNASWKFVNVHAGPIWIYLLGILVLEFLFFYTDLDTHIQNKLDISKDFVYVVAWGVLGGILRALWKIKTSVAMHKHKKSFRIYYLSSPFLGGIFGAITYLLILAGMVSINGPNSSTTNIIPILAIAAFAGFNWEWAVGLFQKIADMFGVNSKKS